MTFLETDSQTTKVQSVYDPCVGTGSLLLVASNWSLRLYGQDIVPDLAMCCELNGWLWMPWLVYMPAWMTALFEEIDGEQAPREHVRLETDPERVEATEAYRAGDLAQADFFEAMGVRT